MADKRTVRILCAAAVFAVVLSVSAITAADVLADDTVTEVTVNSYKDLVSEFNKLEFPTLFTHYNLVLYRIGDLLFHILLISGAVVLS